MNFNINDKVRIADSETYCCETHNPTKDFPIEAIVLEVHPDVKEEYGDTMYLVVTSRLDTELVPEHLMVPA